MEAPGDPWTWIERGLSGDRETEAANRLEFSRYCHDASGNANLPTLRAVLIGSQAVVEVLITQGVATTCEQDVAVTSQYAI